MKKRMLVAATLLSLGLSSTLSATTLQGAGADPLIHAGYPPGFGPGPGDTPDDRIDPNTTDSAFTGIVSLFIQRDGAGFICSGTLISPWHVVSAAHCVDSNGQGQVIDINAPGNAVTVVFNDDGDYFDDPAGSLRTANQVTIHPDYQGFGNCPPGVDSFCLNDDLAVVRLSEAAPPNAMAIPLYEGVVTAGTELTLVGYGTSGDGFFGDYVSPDFSIKRVGANVTDFFEGDDEGGFEFDTENTFDAEVWYADFDGYDVYYDDIDDANFPDGNIDVFCFYFGVCSAQLGNDVETNLGGGDSGGASLVLIDGQYYLAGNNTFGSNALSPAFQDFGISGAFGAYFGGMLLHSYLDWIKQTAVPAPGAIALLGLGLLALRRRK